VHLSGVLFTGYRFGGVLDFLSCADECFESSCKYARIAYFLIIYTYNSPLILNVYILESWYFRYPLYRAQFYLFLHQRMVSVCV